MRAVLPQTSMVLMEVLPPKHWVNSVQLLLHGWGLKHQQNLEQFSYGNTDCVSCMILDVDNLHQKSQVSTALQCTLELENGYQRGAKTQNFLLDASHVSSRNMVSSSWTVTQSASYVPLRHPSDGKTCCRCQLMTKKLRWCDTRIRLLVP